MFEALIPHLTPLMITILRLVVWLILLVCIFVPLERLFELHPAKIWRKEVGIDLIWYFVNSIVPAAIIAIPLSVLTAFLQSTNPFGFYSLMAGLPLWLSVLLILVVNDFGFYWGHRLSHRIPYLWRFHSIHHSAEHMDWLVNTRAHPVDMVISRLSGLIPVCLLGLGQTPQGNLSNGVMIVTVGGIIWSFFIHSNIRARLGPLEQVVSTPLFHHWHHTNDEHRDRNFAAVFPWIDRIFGTAWLPKHWPPVYGIDAKTPSTLVGQLLNPFKKKKRKVAVPKTPKSDSPELL